MRTWGGMSGGSIHMYKSYSLTVEEYEALFQAQGGRCAVCRKEPGEQGGKRLSVDHDHVTGRNRGLICQACNIAIGIVSERPEVLRAMAEYIERWK